MPTQKTISKDPLQFLIEVSRPYSIWAWAAIACSIAAQTLSTSVAYIFRGVVDSATQFSESGGSMSVLLAWVIAYPVFVAGSEFLYRASGFTGMRWVTGLKMTAYSRLFEYLSRHSFAFFSRRFAGSLGSSINNATNGLGALIESLLWNSMPTLIAAIVTVILALTTNVYLGLVFLFWLMLIIPVNLTYARRLADASEASASNMSKLRGFTVDIISNVAAVHSFARRVFEVKNIEEATAEQRRYALKSWVTSEILLLINSIFLAFFAASVVGISFYFWREGVFTLGEFVMTLTLTGNIAWVLLFIGSALNTLATNIGEVRNGLSDIIVPHEITNASGAKPLAVSKGEIELSSVRFGYEANVIFNEFSLKVPPGERVGIVGPSGSGKTTLVSILLRQHDVQGGAITIDGQDIQTVTLESLREAIAMVPQDPYLFHRTIKENIRYGRANASDMEVEEAAKKAQADEFIRALPRWYDTLVGERGVKLSGGQRQRIAIARAILKAAPILVLDEATSSLDSESESEIQKALQELMKGKTVLAIAHRLSTIRAMDRIVVLEGGKVVEDGTHESLLKKPGTYARLWTHQAGGFLPEEEKPEEREETAVEEKN